MAGVIKSGPVDSIAFTRAGTLATVVNTLGSITNVDGSTYTNLGAGFQVNQVAEATAFDLSDETLAMAAGYDKNCLQRHQLNITLYNPNPWLLLNDAQMYNQMLALQVRWSDGSFSTWNDVRFTAVPLMAPVPNMVEAFYHDSATKPHGSLPTGFTSIGDVIVDQGATVSPNTVDDAGGRQTFASLSLEHVFEVDFAHWGSTADTTLDDGQPHSIGIETTDGSYYLYNNVYVEVRRNNVVGLDGIRTTRLRVTKGTGNFAQWNSKAAPGILQLPNAGSLGQSVGTGTHNSSSGGSTPNIPGCLFGIEIVGIATGQDETAFYSETVPV